jgi:S1-C subfamily serine protease
MPVRGTCIVVVIAAVVLTNAPAPLRAVQISDLSIVQIRGLSTQGPALGAGVIVKRRGSRYEILTSKHLTAMRDISVTFGDRFTTSLVTTVATAARDLAVLNVSVGDADPTFSGGFYPPVKLAETSPRAGEPLTVIGHPHGRLYARSAATMYVEIGESFTLLCDACDLGDSGGGVFNSDGELVGILSAVGHVATYEEDHIVGLPARVAFEEPIEQIGALLAHDSF